MENNRQFAHHMLKEIHEQPRTVRDTLAGQVNDASGTVTLTEFPLSIAELKSLAWLRIVASGTSRYAGLYGKYVIEELTGICVDVDYASEFECRRSAFAPPLTIVTSQSGETSDTLAALRKARQEGSRTLAICNVKESSMMREADAALHIKAGPELSVPSTKAFGGQLTFMFLVALHLAQARQSVPEQTVGDYVLQLKKIPDKLESVLRLDRRCAEVADRYAGFIDFIFFGRGAHYPIALDGALKLKEAAYVHTEGYPGGEFKHGQITLFDDQIVAVVSATCDVGNPDSKARYRQSADSAAEMSALSSHLVALVTEGDQRVSKMAKEALYIPEASDLLSPLLEIVPLELLAYHLSIRRGLNPDRPRNLSKAVTGRLRAT
jgi:glucosamine--fructose-6-phosphate aminotransferase (isomerizing)